MVGVVGGLAGFPVVGGWLATEIAGGVELLVSFSGGGWLIVGGVGCVIASSVTGG